MSDSNITKKRGRKQLNKQGYPAFTIIELLVVIVVIAILAAITVVAYSSITQKAIEASLRTDLSNAATTLKMYHTENQAYPNSVIDCPTPSAGNLCLNITSGNTYSSYSKNNSVHPATFTLTASNGSNIFIVTQSTNPVALAPAPLSPVADWLAMAQGDHYGNFYDLVGNSWATVTRSTTKTIYDPSTNHIYDVPVNKLGINPRSDDKGGSEAEIEESRTNYVVNSFGSSNDGTRWTTGWGFVNVTAGTPSASLVQGPYRSTAQRWQYTAVAGDTSSSFRDVNNVTGGGNIAAGNTLVGSMWAKSGGSGVNYQIIIRAYDASWSQLGTSLAPFTPTSSWQRFTNTYANLPTNTVNASIEVQAYNIANGDTADISIDAVQLEKGSFITSYIPTTTLANTRNADTVTVSTANWSSTHGSYYAVSNDSPTTNLTRLISWQKDGSNHISLNSGGGAYGNVAMEYAYTSGGAVKFWTKSSAGYGVRAASWDGTNPVKAYIDGAGGAGTSPVGSLGDMMDYAKIGTFGGLQTYNSSIQRLVVYDSALSDANVIIVTNAIKDGPQ
jgi:general secretion pathway protein G